MIRLCSLLGLGFCLLSFASTEFVSTRGKRGWHRKCAKRTIIAGMPSELLLSRLLPAVEMASLSNEVRKKMFELVLELEGRLHPVPQIIPLLRAMISVRLQEVDQQELWQHAHDLSKATVENQSDLEKAWFDFLERIMAKYPDLREHFHREGGEITDPELN